MFLRITCDRSVKRKAVLTYSAPAPVLLAADRRDDLIQIQIVAELGGATSDRTGTVRPNLLASCRRVSELLLSASRSKNGVLGISREEDAAPIHAIVIPRRIQGMPCDRS
jgi:hypothetical protein